MPTITPVVVFCPHEEISGVWQTVEYGIGGNPPWARVAAWVGPVANEFSIIKRSDSESGNGRILGSLKDKDEAFKLHCELTSMDADRDLGPDYELLKLVLKIFIIIKGDVNGPTVDLDETIKSIKNYCNARLHTNLKFQAQILILQDGSVSPKTQQKVKEIHDILCNKNDEGIKRCRGDRGLPKVFFASTGDDLGHYYKPEEIDFIAGILLHVGSEMHDWKDTFLNPVFRLDPVRIGIRAFLWERVRAIDSTRLPHFKEGFGSKWIEGDGWFHVGKDGQFEPKLPNMSGQEGRTWKHKENEWEQCLWEEIQAEWGKAGRAQQWVSSSDFIKNLVGNSSKLIRGRLTKALRKDHDGTSRGVLVRKILNIISVSTKVGIHNEFRVLNQAVKNVNARFSKDLDGYDDDFFRRGAGLSIIRNHYIIQAKEIGKNIGNATPKEGRDLSQKEISKKAKIAVLSVIQVPHVDTLWGSGLLLFALLSSFFYCLFSALNISDSLVSVILGIGAATIIYYLSRESREKPVSTMFTGGNIRGYVLILGLPTLSFAFWYLFKYVTIGNVIVNLLAGAAAALAITFVYIFTHYASQIAKKERKIEIFIEKTDEMVKWIVHRTMSVAITQIMQHAVEKLSAKAEEKKELIDWGKEVLESLSDEAIYRPKEPRAMTFLGIQNPAKSKNTREKWDNDVRAKTSDWATNFWKVNEYERWREPFPHTKIAISNFLSVCAHNDSFSSHREYLLNEFHHHNLKDSEVRKALWEECQNTCFKDLPYQSTASEGERSHQPGWGGERVHRQTFCFAPQVWIDNYLHDHIYDNLAAGKIVHKAETINDNMICIMKLEHGLSWKALNTSLPDISELEEAVDSSDGNEESSEQAGSKNEPKAEAPTDETGESDESN